MYLKKKQNKKKLKFISTLCLFSFFRVFFSSLINSNFELLKQGMHHNKKILEKADDTWLKIIKNNLPCTNHVTEDPISIQILFAHFCLIHFFLRYKQYLKSYRHSQTFV